LIVGTNSATGASFKGGLLVNNEGTLTMNSTGGLLQIGSGKTLTMDGTLDASLSTVTPTIRSVTGNYTFSIGSTAIATPTLNINANGMYVNATGASGQVTTITRFDNIAFSSGSNVSGATLLNVYATSLYL